LDANFNLKFGKGIVEDSLCKGYIYANLYFYDEAKKEIDKLRQMVEKLHNDVCMELNVEASEPLKLLLEISTRATRMLGNDGLDFMIKEFLSKTNNHLALMADERERLKFQQVCEAIFVELCGSFFAMTLKNAGEVEDGIKLFKFSRAYVATMTDRQKTFVAPALRVIGLENRIKLNGLKIGDDWTVKYTPEQLPTGFSQQEEDIKEKIKEFIQKHS
jgi:hypothetical protein